MRRRNFVASGLGLMAVAAGEGLIGTFTGIGLCAQPAVTLAGPPHGKWVRLAPFPQATGELLGAAINGKLYASHRLLLHPRVAGRIVLVHEAGWLEAGQQPLRRVELAVDRRPQQ